MPTKSRSRTTTEDEMTKKLHPVHPGEVLREEFLGPLGLSVNALARELRTDASRMNGIVHEVRSLTPDTALRLARYFGTTPKFWLNLQTQYDLDVAQDGKAADIAREVRPREQVMHRATITGKRPG